MYTHTIQYSFPQENLTASQIPVKPDFPEENPEQATNPKKNILKNNNNSKAAKIKKSKNRSSFTSKLIAILKPQATPRVSRTRTASGKKVTWNLDEEQIQPGESNISKNDAWPSPGSDEDRLVNPESMDAGSYVMSPGIANDDDEEITTPTNVHHERQQELFDPIIPIHTRTLNPLRAANIYDTDVSHKRSSSFPHDEGVPEESQVAKDHKRFSSLDDIEPKINYENHQQSPWYKQANVDWTQNRIKSSGTKPVRTGKEFLNSWSGKNQNQSIFDDLSQFLDSNTDSVVASKRITFPMADDQTSMIESEASSIHTWVEHDDCIEDDPRPFLYEQSFPVHPTRRLQPNNLTNPVKMILPPIHPQPSRRSQENYIILPMQSYSTSTVCEITFSSQITLLPSNSLTKITFDTHDTPTSITKNNSPTICEISDRQCPPFYINASSSLPHLNLNSKSNPRMSYRQIHIEGQNTVPRTKRSYRSPYQHLLPEASTWIRQVPIQAMDRIPITPSSGSDPYLDCDKSTGQMVSPSLRCLPFKRGYLEKNNSSMRPTTSFSHLYTNRPAGSLKWSYSASCVRDDLQNPSPYVCYTAHDPTPAYIEQEAQSPYMNMDELMNQCCTVEGADDKNIGYRAPPRYFTPHPLGICCECNEYIYPAPCQPVRIRNRIFHPDCFKCADCYSLLHVLSYYETKGKFYCPRDFRRHVICHLCKQPLASYRGRESPVNVYDKFFHPQCYRCTSCNTQTQKLSFDGKWLLCLLCSQARRNQTIKPTHLTPRKTLVTLL